MPEPNQPRRVLGNVSSAKPRVFRIRHGVSVLLLGSGTIKIGRRTDCDYPLNDSKVSREHARLIVSEQTIAIEDLNSANGILVNGERLRRLRSLATGDTFQIGAQHFEVLRPAEVQLEEDNLVTVIAPLSSLVPPKIDTARESMPTRNGEER
jgi:pSer/pThr/pTyr-binding forkhead associated (FHA) protein